MEHDQDIMYVLEIGVEPQNWTLPLPQQLSSGQTSWVVGSYSLWSSPFPPKKGKAETR